MMDDAQEWGRKRISELYVKKSSNYDFESVTAYFGEAGEYGTYRDEGEDKNVNKFEMKENFTFPSNEEENVKEVLKACGNSARDMKKFSVMDKIQQNGILCLANNLQLNSRKTNRLNS